MNWPYSTHDEVSHLACEDVGALRDRIDQLIEERHEWRRANGETGTVRFPSAWKLTGSEQRLLECLARRPSVDPVASKPRLHSAIAGADEPDSDIKIVDVFICKIRAKLKALDIDPSIETAWGRGYRLTDDLRGRYKPS